MNQLFFGRRRLLSLGLSLFLVLTCFQGSLDAGTLSQTYADTGPSREIELRGVWISYLEWNELPIQREAFYQSVDQMFDQIKGWGMNAVFVHVRPDSDAMYPSSYFPWSKFASGTQGSDPGYDPLAYMVEAAHARNLEFHAWINPYRVTGYLMNYDELSANNPAKVWLTDGSSENDRWVLLHDGAYYYNPAILQVRHLITEGVREIVANYPVDGIHFDDYFYPSVDNSNAQLWFDKPEYDAAQTTLSLTKWRQEQVNTLLREVYQVVKETRSNTVFGVSPAGYVQNLTSDSMLFVDIDTWMSVPGYIDYIMPQLYWGFHAKLKDSSPAPYAYTANLQTWIDLAAQGNVKLYLGLAMSRAGTNVNDHNPVSEWLSHQDILKRQVEAARSTGRVAGYCFYSYRSFHQPNAQPEVHQLLSILK